MSPKRAAVGFAVFGIADLVAALSIGFLAGLSPAQVFHGVSTPPPSQLSLALIPTSPCQPRSPCTLYPSPTSARATAADRRPGTVPGSQPGDSVTPTGDDRQPGLRGASVDSQQGLSDNGAGG